MLWLFATSWRLFFNFKKDHDENLFFEKFFLIMQIFFISVGALNQKKMIDNINWSLLVLGFYVYLFAAMISLLNYTFMYMNYQWNEDVFVDINEPYRVYIDGKYFLNICTILGIFMAYIVSECFSYTVLMYFNRKASVSKATLFGALHAVFVIIMKYIFDVVPELDSFFFVIILIWYFMIFQSKHAAAKSKKKSEQTIIFKRKLSIVSQTGMMFAQTQLKMGNK